MNKMMDKENTNFIIYKAQNIITGECYIGATTKTIDERKQDHLQKANKGATCKFHNAITTYGQNSFNWVQIDTATSTDELAEKEIKYILANKSLKEGNNSDKGGGFKKTVYQYNLKGDLINSFDNLTSASETINVRKQDISRACWSVNHTLGGYLWSYDYKESFVIEPDNRKKQVLQYNLKGEKLARYISASEASRKTGVSKTCITRCCRGERVQTGGFLWKYS